MKITFYGHACLGIEVSNKNIIIDPFITGNEKASHIDINLLKADYILVTHAHFDHIQDVEVIAKNNNAVIVSNDNYRDLMQEKTEWKRIIETKFVVFLCLNIFSIEII